jgi:hypothetical protein
MRKIAFVILVLAATVTAEAVIFSGDEFMIDLAEPNSVTEHELVWEPADKVKQTDDGLVFKNDAPNTSVDFCLLTKAYPIGLSWRPTSAATLGVELAPLDKDIEYDGMTLQPSFYVVYVRYSPDMKNWSSWHAMQDQYRDWQQRNEAGKYQYKLRLQVPQKERKAYSHYVSQYSSMDVPWKSDAEAAVKWILTQEPDFFEKHIPFIGYLQFLCETSMRANQPLSEMKISIGWGVGGLHSIPKDESDYRIDLNTPWRLKAVDEKN